MNDVLFATLVAFATAALMKVIESILERRKAGAAERRADEGTALEQVRALWAELRQLKADHDKEIEEIRAEHKAEIAELRTQVDLARYRTGQAEKRALLAEQERGRALAEIQPLRAEVEQLRLRVKELEKVNGHG